MVTEHLAQKEIDFPNFWCSDLQYITLAHFEGFTEPRWLPWWYLRAGWSFLFWFSVILLYVLFGDVSLTEFTISFTYFRFFKERDCLCYAFFEFFFGKFRSKPDSFNCIYLFLSSWRMQMGIRRVCGMLFLIVFLCSVSLTVLDLDSF